MSSKGRPIDRFFLISVAVLTLLGFVIFLSASLGLLAQDGTSFTTIALKQGIGLVLGIIAFSVFSRLKYTTLRKSAFFIFLGALALNIALFIPGLAVYHGGASRWIDIGFISFQPSEFLKIAFIIYLAAWIQFAKDKIKTFRYGIVPALVLMTIVAGLLLAQSDTDTLAVILFTGILMLLVAGMPIKHLAWAGLLGIVIVAGVIYVRPYAAERVKTFLNNSADTQGAGYQINQSLIAIGSGGTFGRGFGQSIQKFGYLPQPTDDSIFAVAMEEFGFAGGIALLGIYVMFAASTFRVGIRAEDTFGGLLAIGIAVLVITESFLNMAAMLGITPLSGLPLLFVSHGGTALVITLAAAGMVANVSRYHR